MIYQDKSKYVKSDGYFREREQIAFRTDGEDWHRGKIFQILSIGKNKTYEYNIDFGGMYLWVDRRHIKKVPKDTILRSFTKYKIGDRVTITNQRVYEGDPYFIKNIRLGPYKSLEYVLEIISKWGNYDYVVGEKHIRLWKEPVRIISPKDPWGEEDWSDDEEN